MFGESLSRVRLFVTPRTIKSMQFSRPEYRSGLPFPSPADLSNPGIEPRSPALQADSLPAELPGKPWCLEEWCQIRSIVGVQGRGGRGGSVFLSWATILDCGTWEAVIEDGDQRPAGSMHVLQLVQRGVAKVGMFH